MTLTAGARLGVYEIQAAIGAGGMGEVYRARDNKLGRDVALKILSESLTHDPERIARFRREARVLASQNDPHIGAIYGLEDAGLSTDSGQATMCLVLEHGGPIRFASNGKTVEPGTPLGLFATNVDSMAINTNRQQYVVSPDGQPFVMNSVVGAASASSITVILNWKPRPH